MHINFRNFSLLISEETILVFLIITGISYYIFFGKHHKRNAMKYNEIYPLVINYLALFIISFFILAFGVDIVLTGYIYNEEVSEVIKELFIGFSVISLVILNFIFYIKRHNIDLIQADREAKEKIDAHIGEWVEIVVFILIILVSVFNIFKYISFIDKFIKYKQIFISILCIITSSFLLYHLNPLDIKNKIKSLFKRR